MSQQVQDRIEVVQGDITQQNVDAVVNAANPELMPGGGVAGAIHRAAGPDLKSHCATLGGCRTGEAVLTPGFNLPAPHIIHTVGPVYRGGGSGEAEQLAASYCNSLKVAADNDLKSVAFPLLSTGAYGYPPDEAVKIAVQTISQWLSQNDLPEKVTICAFDGQTKRTVEKALHG